MDASGSGERTTRLTVLYDESCALCRRCRDWLLGQPCLVEVELVAAGSVLATVRYRPWAYRLAGPTLAPMAERFFMLVSKRRDRVSAWVVRREPPGPDCSWCDEIGIVSSNRTD